MVMEVLLNEKIADCIAKYRAAPGTLYRRPRQVLLGL